MTVATKPKKKPSKPFPTFPLTAHPNGQWCKKIRGKVHFFGVWADPKTALQEYNRQADDLQHGRRPMPRVAETLTLKELGNAYLNAQHEKAKRNLISPAWFRDCRDAVRRFVRSIGTTRAWSDVRPTDFGRYRLSLYDKLGVCAIQRHITVIRSMFSYAYESELIDRPVRYGGQFDKPSTKEKRQNRSTRDRQNGKRLFEPAEIQDLLDSANQPLRTMILLGVNAGFGNTDCAELPISAIDLERGVIDYERRKTAVLRVAPLWPETAAAIKETIERRRPAPRKPEHADRVFLTKFGNPWKLDSLRQPKPDGSVAVGRQQAISLEFNKLLEKLGMKRKGVSFYALRHTFRTWADEVNDQHAIHRIMGHSIPGMSGVYVEEIAISRLQAVTDHVRSKVFGLTA